jgi:hypothetical protein
MNVTPITLASRMVSVVGTQRRSQLRFAVIPAFAQKPAGSTATAMSSVARNRRGPSTIRDAQHVSATPVDAAKPKNRVQTGK